MKHNSPLRRHRTIRRLLKLYRDPERFFLDSSNPRFVTFGQHLVRRREKRAARLHALQLQKHPFLFRCPEHVCGASAAAAVSVVVPVFNAPRQLAQCLDSLFRHTPQSVRVIIIDDASTSPEVQELLQGVERPNLLLERNQENRGYTATINRGIALAGQDDVVLLNSDTQVGPRWLQNLRLAVHQAEDIATATPLSDNAGAFSAPVRSCRNELPAGRGPADVARAVFQQGVSVYPEAPTGNGFCMYIRRKALDEVGGFDEQAFPRGYCEENDWCQRALARGWRHVVDCRTYVLHHRSASFGPEKDALISVNRAKLDSRHPQYTAQVREFMRSPAMQQGLDEVQAAFKRLASPARVRPRVLYVIASQTGGTPMTNADLMGAVADEYAPLLLLCDSNTLELRDMSGSRPRRLERTPLIEPVRAPAHVSADYDSFVQHWLVKYGVELVHVRHLSWHSLNLPWLAKSLDIPVVFSFHDFYMACPNTQLVDEAMRHCAGFCTQGSGDCDAPLWSAAERPPLKDAFVHQWREMTTEVLGSCAAFVTTCETARRIMIDVHPGLAAASFRVIPHGRDFRSFTPPAPLPLDDGPIRIVFPGNLSRAKGMELILELMRLDVDQRLELHLLGKVAARYCAEIDRRTVFHGPYKREDFQKKIARIRPHFAGIFSLWPETWCHTLTEAWAAGLPALVTPFGAPMERVQEGGGGFVLPSVDARDVYGFICSLADQPEAVARAREQVLRWQQETAPRQTVAAMASGYKALYAELGREYSALGRDREAS